jgi:crotonobetainyl-CoA:carnitine CoA-transferase CaiB-like acyl-CoA transferase
VLVENFRPGVLDKRGYSYEAVKQRNPGIIYCSLSGFGPSGPASEKPGQDLLIQSLSGLAMLTGNADGPPVPVGSAIVDQHAATLGAMGVIASLFARTRTGQGARVDSNLLSAAMDQQTEPFNYHLNGAELYPRSPSGISSRFHRAPYGVYQTGDGWLTLSLSDCPTLAKAFDDPRFNQWTKTDQFDKREELNSLVVEHIVTKTTEEWEEILDQWGMWNARVRDYDEVENAPQLAANGSILEFDLPRAGKVRVLGHPVQYNGASPGLRLLPPGPGEHTAEVLSELGYAAQEIEGLRAANSIGPDRSEKVFDRATSAATTSYSARKPSLRRT